MVRGMVGTCRTECSWDIITAQGHNRAEDTKTGSGHVRTKSSITLIDVTKKKKKNPARAGREDRAELKAINVEDGAPAPAPNTIRVPLVIRLRPLHPALQPRKLPPNQNHINNPRFN